MTLTPTPPAAIAALYAHMNAVAEANFDTLKPGVYIGEIIGNVADNFLAIGNPTGNPGDMIVNYQAIRAGSNRPGAARLEESYGIYCTLRTWARTVDPLARLTDAFTLIAALTSSLGDDPQGRGADPTAAPSLGSGSWLLSGITNEHAGAMKGQGWGCEFTFEVVVSDVILTSR